MTWLNTAIGAVPGALPPMMGWTAARGELSGEGWALFAILAFWQIPHFMAIAWIYRDEYAKAGFKMLPVVDPDGLRTGQQAVSHTLALLIVSLCPVLFQMAGTGLSRRRTGSGRGLSVVRDPIFTAAPYARAELTLARARQLFLASIIYLPLLLAVMVWDKIK